MKIGKGGKVRVQIRVEEEKSWSTYFGASLGSLYDEVAFVLLSA